MPSLLLAAALGHALMAAGIMLNTFLGVFGHGRTPFLVFHADQGSDNAAFIYYLLFSIGIRPDA